MHKKKKAQMRTAMVIIVLGLILLLFAPAIISKTYKFLQNIKMPFSDEEEKLDMNKANEEYLIKENTDAGKYFVEGNYKDAADRYTMIIDKDTKGQLILTSLYQIAESFYQTDQYGKAAKYFEQYIEKKTDDKQQNIDTAYEHLLDIYLTKTINKEKAKALVDHYKEKYKENDYYNRLRLMLDK
ncbi:MAG: hypothetical protein ABIG89_06270 [Candidatus Woesearchaeota archaeon]